MVATLHTLDTTGMVWYSSGLGNPTTEVTSWIHERLRAWLGEICNPILDSATLVGGSGYTDGTYNDVELVRTSNQVNGRNLLADVTIAGGTVSTVTITQKGNGFKTGDTLVFKDLSQVGGTGGGFTIDVQSADASLCINRDPDDSTGSRYGWYLGVERGATNCVYGQSFLWKNSNTSSTTYFFNWYNWTDTTSNNGTGTWTTSSQTSVAFWTNNQAGHQIYLVESSDPDDQFIAISDTNYQHVHYIARTNRAPGGNYIDTAIQSQWVNGYSNTSYPYANAVNNGPFTTPYVGATGFYSLKEPTDGYCLFRGLPVWARGTIVGNLPPSMGTHDSGSGQSPGSTLTDGTEEWTALNPTLYFKTAD